MTRSTLGLAITRSTDPTLVTLLTYLRRWCDIRQADPADAVDAWMVDDATDPAMVNAGSPVIVWTRDAQTPAARRWSELGTLVGPSSATTSPDLATLTVPEPGVDATACFYVAPLVRRRWRDRLGLPADLVIPIGLDRGAALPPELMPTALAVASVVVAVGDLVLGAMCWGAPTATDDQTAARLGLAGAVHIADQADLAAAGAALCRDDGEMARLSWSARRLVEESFDLAGAAYTVAETARLVRQVDPSAGVLTRLNELWASPATALALVRKITAQDGPSL